MSRRHAAEERFIEPDPEYNDGVVAKFTNCLMVSGKKAIAETIVRKAFITVAERTKRDPLEVFHEALAAVRPLTEVRSRRVGGATYQVPMDLRDRRASALAIRWIIAFARKRSEKKMFLRLAAELMDAVKGAGGAMKKRTDVHKMAESNRANGHYRW